MVTVYRKLELTITQGATVAVHVGNVQMVASAVMRISYFFNVAQKQIAVSGKEAKKK